MVYKPNYDNFRWFNYPGHNRAKGLNIGEFKQIKRIHKTTNQSKLNKFYQFRMPMESGFKRYKFANFDSFVELYHWSITEFHHRDIKWQMPCLWIRGKENQMSFVLRFSDSILIE